MAKIFDFDERMRERATRWVKEYVQLPPAVQAKRILQQDDFAVAFVFLVEQKAFASVDEIARLMHREGIALHALYFDAAKTLLESWMKENGKANVED